jgi:hypothetical protein
MDPLSILGALSASSALLKLIANTIKDLAAVHDKFHTADRATRFLIDELSSLNIALSQIQSWVEGVRAAGHARDGAMYGVNETLRGCNNAMDDLTKDISRLIKVSGSEIRTNRAKYVWKETEIKEHQARLESNKISLILVLLAAQWWVF